MQPQPEPQALTWLGPLLREQGWPVLPAPWELALQLLVPGLRRRARQVWEPLLRAEPRRPRAGPGRSMREQLQEEQH